MPNLRVLVHGVLMVFFLGLLPSAAAQAGGKDETERWVPSLALTSGILVQGATASASSSDVYSYAYTGTPSEPGGCNTPTIIEPNPPQPICPILSLDPVQPATSGSSPLLAPTVGGDLEIMTPGLTQVIGRPRLFAHAGVDYSFGFDYDVAKEGVAEPMFVPPHNSTWPVVAVPGQGTRVTANIDPVVVRAGLGIAFTSEVWGRRLRIKPSVEWMVSSVHVAGLTNRAYEATVPAYVTSPARFYLISLQSEADKTFNSIGPGLEFEIDTVRVGPFMIALGISASAYRVLGSREVDLSARSNIQTGKPALPGDPSATPPLNPSPALPPNVNPLVTCPGGTGGSPGSGCAPWVTGSPTFAGPFDGPINANWHYEQDAWSYRGGIAVRFRYAPE